MFLSKNILKEFLHPYQNPEVLLNILYGFINGLLLLLSGNTLNFWLAKRGIDVKTLGLISLIALPYALKYSFAPLIDRFKLPFITNFYSQRKSWIIFCLATLIIFIYLISTTNPNTELYLTCIYGFIISFFSASIDIALNAHRIETVKKSYMSQASATYIIGYRFGMLVSGAGAIYLSSFINWNQVYQFTAIFTLILLVIFILLPDNMEEKPVLQPTNSHSNWLYRIFIMPFSHLGKSSNIILIISFIAIYRLADNMIIVMLNPLLLQIGFNEIEIATAGKLFGIGSAIIGGLIAGAIIPYIGTKRSLLYFGILHLLTHLLYFALIAGGNSLNLLYTLTGLEAFSGGMTMAAYFTYITSLCKGKYIGTQYALLFSVMGISRVIFPSISGYIVNYSNWTYFFLIMIVVSIPGLILIRFIKN